MMKKSLLLVSLLLTSHSSRLFAYDEDSSTEQQQGDRQQGKQVKEGLRDAQTVMSKGESVKREITNPTTVLKGRALDMFNNYKKRGYGPKVYEISRNGVPTWLLTANIPNSTKGFRYTFFSVPR